MLIPTPGGHRLRSLPSDHTDGCCPGIPTHREGVLDDLMLGADFPTSQELTERGGDRWPGRGYPCAIT